MSEKQKLFEQLKKEQITQGEFERRLDELKQKENISKTPKKGKKSAKADKKDGPSANIDDTPKGANLLNYWYPLCFVTDLPKQKPYPCMLYGQPLVLFYDKKGDIVCLQDRCSHRSTPLSIGVWVDGAVECRYHGWTFGTDGECIRIPSFAPDEKIPAYARVPHYPTKVREGMVWIWPGDTKLMSDKGFPKPVPELDQPDMKLLDGTYLGDYSFESAIENLLDPTHLQFVHEGQQGDVIGPRNVNYPDASVATIEETGVEGGFLGHIVSDKTVKKTNYLLEFEPPCTVRLEVKFPNGTWKFHQMHYLIPVQHNKVKMLLRSFRNWLKFIPASTFAANNYAVLLQDIGVLLSQKRRLDQGSSRWNLPVPADNMAVRFKKWIDDAQRAHPVWFKSFNSTMKSPSVELTHDIEDLGDANKCCTCASSDMYACDDQKTLQNVIDKEKKIWPKSTQDPPGALGFKFLRAMNFVKNIAILLVISFALYFLAVKMTWMPAKSNSELAIYSFVIAFVSVASSKISNGSGKK
jgi:phenylpropionate dioxygenase-like ring-hydroxylating dioxygenase large terminal subunit